MRVICGLMVVAAPLLRADILVFGQNCTAEMVACENDTACAACGNNTTVDRNCDWNDTDCASLADYYCCVAGDACSNNTLLLDYINCGIELDSCTLTDVCNYDNATATSGIDDDDDEDGNICTVEYSACQNNTACAACHNNATMDGTCDRNATDCAGVADYYCCVTGDGCSANTLLVDYINCEIEVESCILADVCDYSTPAPSATVTDENPGYRTGPRLLSAGVLVVCAAILLK